MKKRFGLLCLSLLVSSFTIYSMEEENGSDVSESCVHDENSMDYCHVTSYAIENGWIDRDSELEKQLCQKEEKMREEQGEYGKFLKKVLAYDLSKKDQRALKIKVMRLATGLSEKQTRAMLKYKSAKNRVKRRDKTIGELQSLNELLENKIRIAHEELQSLNELFKSNNYLEMIFHSVLLPTYEQDEGGEVEFACEEQSGKNQEDFLAKQAKTEEKVDPESKPELEAEKRNSISPSYEEQLEDDKDPEEKEEKKEEGRGRSKSFARLRKVNFKKLLKNRNAHK